MILKLQNRLFRKYNLIWHLLKDLECDAPRIKRKYFMNFFWAILKRRRRNHIWQHHHIIDRERPAIFWHRYYLLKDKNQFSDGSHLVNIISKTTNIIPRGGLFNFDLGIFLKFWFDTKLPSSILPLNLPKSRGHYEKTAKKLYNTLPAYPKFFVTS